MATHPVLLLYSLARGIAMNTKPILLISAIAILICSAFSTTLYAQDIQIPDEAVFKRAFDSGNSFAVAKVIAKLPKGSDWYRVRLCVERLPVPGDLTLKSIRKPIDAFTSKAYMDKLTVGHTYALFLSREIPYGYTWSFRSNFYDLDTGNQKEMDNLIRVAKQSYRASAVYRFRNTKPDQKEPISNVPASLLDICKQFEDNPGKRAVYGRSIGKSDIASHSVDSYSSKQTYEPPKTKLSRGQIIRLLGQPTLKCGFTYYWYCGVDNDPVAGLIEEPVTAVDPSPKYFGVLTVTFDPDEQTHYLRYTVNSKKWE